MKKATQQQIPTESTEYVIRFYRWQKMKDRILRCHKCGRFTSEDQSRELGYGERICNTCQFIYKSCDEWTREGDDAYCCDLWEGHPGKHSCNHDKVSWEAEK